MRAAKLKLKRIGEGVQVKRATIFVHACVFTFVLLGAVVAQGEEMKFTEPGSASSENVDQQSPVNPTGSADASIQCDRLAADPKDKDKPADVAGVDQPSAEAVEACAAAVTADPQNARLNYQAGRAYRQSKDFAKAFYYFDRASSLGSLRAAVAVADAYSTGAGVAKDFDKAVELYTRAASRGDPEAVVEIGRYYSKGPKKNVDLAVNWLTSVETGEAFMALGNLYLTEVQNDAIALKWYRKAAELKMPHAYRLLGEAYSLGRGVPQDAEEALMWDKLAWEALPQVTTKIARYYQLAGDTEQMLQWLERGAARGDALSAGALGRIYRYSETDRDFAKAMTWFQKADELGDKIALVEIGRMYQDGLGVQQDIPRAIDYYRIAIEKGALVYWEIANAYQLLSPSDYRSAFEWHKKGAEAGASSVMFNLAANYRDGKGVKQNYKEALVWFKKAAELGDKDAMNQVGIFYHDGRGTKLNYIEAGRWYEKAGAAGHAWGNRNLAFLFAHGQGVNKDTWLAVDLLELAMATSVEVCSDFKKNSSKWPHGFLQAFQSRLADRYSYQGASDGKLGSGSMTAIDTLCAKKD